MQALLEKYLLRSIPREGDGKDGAADKGSLISVQPKPPTFDLTSIGADMNDGPDQTKDFIIQEDNQPVDEMEAEAPAAEYVDDPAKSAEENAAAKAEHDKALADAKAKDGDGKGDGDGKAKSEGKDGGEKKTAEKKDGDGDGDGEMPGWMKRRLERQERKHARELAELREQIAAKEAKPAQAEDPGPAPKASDFSDFEAYLEAKAEHEDKVKAFKAKKPADAGKPADEKKPDTKAKPDTELIEAIEDIQEALGDDKDGLWAKVTAAKDLPISRNMAIAIADLDHPASVLKQFLDKPELAEEISKLSPARQAIRLAKLDVAQAAPAKKAEPSKKLTEAPAPIKPIDGKASVDKPLDAHDFAGFEAARNEEERSRVKAGDFWL